MLNEMLIAGFGGQGIVTLGKLIAYAGMLEGREVSCYTRYGAEMRGGTAQCTVILSSDAIDSPVIDAYDTVVAMNQPSMTLFQNKVKSSGQLIWNRSLCTSEPDKTGIDLVGVDATTIATELNNPRIANMVAFGAIAVKTGLFSVDSAITAMKKRFTRMTQDMFELNQAAVKRGYEKCA
ncbi:MAG: 2-oxoacid:acceptor oxidoreductase family protein [Desulfobacteraceae bacterium]|nr:2-oxoacid:acceptor oxidoreductase family protein [Desulfobacteraceae bacterium]